MERDFWGFFIAFNHDLVLSAFGMNGWATA